MMISSRGPRDLCSTRFIYIHLNEGIPVINPPPPPPGSCSPRLPTEACRVGSAAPDSLPSPFRSWLDRTPHPEDTHTTLERPTPWEITKRYTPARHAKPSVHQLTAQPIQNPGQKGCDDSDRWVRGYNLEPSKLQKPRYLPGSQKTTLVTSVFDPGTSRGKVEEVHDASPRAKCRLSDPVIESIPSPSLTPCGGFIFVRIYVYVSGVFCIADAHMNHSGTYQPSPEFRGEAGSRSESQGLPSNHCLGG